jgi:hypothetical protein
VSGKMNFGSRCLSLASLSLLFGCGGEAPTNPSHAVTITAPTIVEPANASTVTVGQVATMLVVGNSTSSASQPLTYSFEIATDPSFSTVIFSRAGVPQGDGGRTTVLVDPALEAGRTFVWRARATDGTTTGPSATPSQFTTAGAQTLEPPAVIAPENGTTLGVPSLEFRFAPAARTGDVSGVAYRVEVALDDALTTLVAVLTVAEQPGETAVPLAGQLDVGRHYFWRVQTISDSITSEWSPVYNVRAASFRWPTTGEEVVAFVSARYAAYLAPVGSLGERQANMAFLRDRMIEAGLCGGMDLGWNMKRGGPEISIDFLTHRVNGHVEGIDIGHDYDNHREPLKLTWSIGEFPYYRSYHAAPQCQ